ncbi:uncharacterized protein BJX67DRAFT_28884 [Aspergillus lucknowensis]|uniref:Uncharacterized protein n=1 Tax=Aspergillus lucknowensis TaxID=176173 RepID=A0ABR4L8P2_9EURO
MAKIPWIAYERYQWKGGPNPDVGACFGSPRSGSWCENWIHDHLRVPWHRVWDAVRGSAPRNWGISRQIETSLSIFGPRSPALLRKTGDLAQFSRRMMQSTSLHSSTGGPNSRWQYHCGEHLFLVPLDGCCLLTKISIRTSPSRGAVKFRHCPLIVSGFGFHCFGSHWSCVFGVMF